MALIKMRPTSPGTRFVVKVDRSHLHKGGPLTSLTIKKNRTGARNHSGRQTSRHIGGGHKQRYRFIDFKRNKSASRPWSSRSNTIRAAPRASLSLSMPTANSATSSPRSA